MWYRVTDMSCKKSLDFFGKNLFSEALIGLFLTEQKWLKPTAVYMVFFSLKLHLLFLGWETLLCWNHEWGFRTLMWQKHYVLKVAVGCFFKVLHSGTKNHKDIKVTVFYLFQRWERCFSLDARGDHWWHCCTLPGQGALYLPPGSGSGKMCLKQGV